MNYLELCNYLIRRVGISGAHVAMTDVAGQTGRAQSVVDWIREADMDIQREWNDWTFHNRELEMVWNAGNQYLDETQTGWQASVARFNTGSFSARTNTHRQHIPFQEWKDFRDRSGIWQQTANGIPLCITQDQSGRLQIVPTDVTFVLNCEVHVKPYEMTVSASVSPIPEQYHEIIMHKAATKYAMYEEADNIRAYHQEEYARLFEQLESVALPDGDRTNISTDEDPLMVVAV